MDFNPPVIAGIISTMMFGLSTLPMLRKAFQTKDLRSYSLGNITLSNAGNAIHSLYVFSLPPGPIWLLHSFHLLTTALMLIWYLRYELWPVVPCRQCVRGWSAVASLFKTWSGSQRHESLPVSAQDRQTPSPGESHG